MLRKLASVVGSVVVTLVVLSGTASAAPYDPATLSVVDIGAPGGDYQVDGANFGNDVADDNVALTVTYGAPSGLRASSGLTEALRAESYTVDVDDEGNFTTVISVTQDGDFLVTAVGNPSGETVRAAATVGGGSVATTTAGAGAGSSGSGNVTGWSDGSSDGGLASTGANIAGPIAVGLGILAVGLALLFFGTRGVIRRKRPKTTAG